jgi:hypothetical protein
MLVTPNPEGLTRCKDLLKNKNIFKKYIYKKLLWCPSGKMGKNDSQKGCACFKDETLGLEGI